ncbi:unnamed protein product, partial [Ixodes hexagonus]
SFVIDKKNKCFLKDNQPFQFISGSIHYFRVPRAYWKDRLRKMRMAGLNTIASVVEWSGHEPYPGQYHFLDNYDVVEFCKEAQREDLLVILRVGPYIDSERDNGGLPSWLFTRTPSIKVRTTDNAYMNATEKWLGKILPMIRNVFYKNGGPVIALQFEHSYSRLPRDTNYITGVYNMFKKHVGDDVILFTYDYFDLSFPTLGGVDGVPKAAGYIPLATSNTPRRLISEMNAANTQGCPVFVIDCFAGYFSRWRQNHFDHNHSEDADSYRELMRLNVSINLFMFHGGTNFGFGAAFERTTSNDYDAALSEAGDPTDFYDMIKVAIEEFAPHTTGGVLAPSSKLKFGAVSLTEGVSLKETMSHFRANGWLKYTRHSDPMTFEEMGQDYGFVMYTAKPGSVSRPTLELSGINDRAYVVTKHSRHVLDYYQNTATIEIEDDEALVIYVENRGRIYYGFSKAAAGGINGSVKLDGTKVQGWTMEAVPIVENKDVSRIMQLLEDRRSTEVPGFFHGTFTLPPEEDPVRDTFLDPTGWSAGFAFINGINLGRYWPKKGPQVTLYLPGAFLLPYPEENRLFLLEMEGAPGDRTVKLVGEHILDGPIDPTWRQD